MKSQRWCTILALQVLLQPIHVLSSSSHLQVVFTIHPVWIDLMLDRDSIALHIFDSCTVDLIRAYSPVGYIPWISLWFITSEFHGLSFWLHWRISPGSSSRRLYAPFHSLYISTVVLLVFHSKDYIWWDVSTLHWSILCISIRLSLIKSLFYMNWPSIFMGLRESSENNFVADRRIIGVPRNRK